MRRPVRIILLVLLACACARDSAPKQAGSAAVGREAWWKQATTRPSGQERILAPRELKALLADGRGLGFNADAKWWSARRAWVYGRVLELDASDLDGNEAVGRRVLQRIAGFQKLWARMLDARVTNEAIADVLDQYGSDVHEGNPVFLSSDALVAVQAQLERARQHLDRLARDPKYAAVQVALARVRGSVLSDYPSVHIAAGPFLLFYCAPDLRRIEGEDDAEEEKRITARREFYRERLEARRASLEGVIADVEKLYPEVWKRHGLAPNTILYQWIFGDRAWYTDFVDRLNRGQPENAYRSGFHDRATGWAYLFEPEKQETAEADRDPDARSIDPEQQLRETMAYLAAGQLLYRWGKDKKDRTKNHIYRSHAYWLHEGWASFLAARQVKEPLAGPALSDGKRFGMIMPPIRRVVERRSRLDLLAYREPEPEYDPDEEPRPPLGVVRHFTDLSLQLVKHFHDPKRRPAFERFLLSQIEGTRHGRDWFEKCFGIEGDEGWADLQRRVYGGIK